MYRKVPLVVILGSTGTGKTKLSLELAQRFGGEIISADSMQVYKGLDVVTAKATKEEQSKAVHHLLDVIQPGEYFTVVNFRDLAVPIIDKIMGNSKLPIVVGGTNYYIESLLWKVLIANDADKNVAPSTTTADTSDVIELIQQRTQSDYHPDTANISDKTHVKCKKLLELGKTVNMEEIEKMAPQKMHDFLAKYDAASAQRLHPNNRRKIIRALEVMFNTGKTLTEHLNAQRKLPGASSLGGPLRYEDAVIFWLRCDQETLNERLDSRVDAMLSDGLLNEIRTFYNAFKENDFGDCTVGILQTIGFKEFLPYLEKYDPAQDAVIEVYINNKNSDDKLNEPEGYSILNSCLEELKLVTKRYSKKQIKWVRNRLLGCTERQVPSIYTLDTTNVEQWKANVAEPALEIVQSYFDGKEVNHKATESYVKINNGFKEEISFVCEICKRNFVGEFQWHLHLKSNKHKKVAAGKRRITNVDNLVKI